MPVGELVLLIEYDRAAATSAHAYLCGIDVSPATTYLRFLVPEPPQYPVSTSKHAYLKGAYAAETTWPKLPITDDFNRADLGSNWTIRGGSPSIVDNHLEHNGSDIYWNAYTMNPDVANDFYFTVVDLHDDPTFQHLYIDYFWTASPDTSYRLTVGYVNTTWCQIAIQWQSAGGGYTELKAVSVSYSSRTEIKVGVRHQANGYITVFVDIGSGWTQLFTVKNTSVHQEGVWRFQGGGNSSGDPNIDDFSIGASVNGKSQPAYLKGIGKGVTSKPAYLEGFQAGTPVKTSHAAFLKANAKTVTSKSAYLKGSSNVVTSKAAYLKGFASSVTSKPAFLKGWAFATASHASFLAGGIKTVTSKPSYLKGDSKVVTSKPAYLSGYSAGVTSHAAYLRGRAMLAVNQPAYLKGSASAVGSHVAYLAGRDVVSTTVHAYIKGKSEYNTFVHAILVGTEISLYGPALWSA